MGLVTRCLFFLRSIRVVSSRFRRRTANVCFLFYVLVSFRTFIDISYWIIACKYSIANGKRATPNGIGSKPINDLSTKFDDYKKNNKKRKRYENTCLVGSSSAKFSFQLNENHWFSIDSVLQADSSLTLIISYKSELYRDDPSKNNDWPKISP